MLLAAMLSASTFTAESASAETTIICNQPGDPNAAFCPVHSGAWAYYEAYLSRGGDGDLPSATDASIRMQILARMGSTSVIIGGIWVVYMTGPRTYVRTQIQAVDGKGKSKDGPWDDGGGFHGDVAVRGGSGISRWAGVSPSAPVGLVRGSKSMNPLFALNLWLFNESGEAQEHASPLHVVFN